MGGWGVGIVAGNILGIRSSSVAKSVAGSRSVSKSKFRTCGVEAHNGGFGGPEYGAVGDLLTGGRKPWSL